MDILTPVLCLCFLVIGALTGYWAAKTRYKAILCADKRSKILGFAQKKALEADGERVVKLDFASLLKDMETHYRLWTGHKHNVRLGIWINWLKTVLDKKQNTR